MVSDGVFNKATEWLSQHGVGAVDWAALAAKRQDSVRNPAYMDQYMLPAFQRCAAVIDTLDLMRAPPDEVLKSYSILTTSIGSLGDKALEVLKINTTIVKTLIFPSSALEFGVKLDVAIINVFTYYMWSAALTGANAHITGRIHQSGLPDAEIAYHASLVTMCLNLITWMNGMGMFGMFKKKGASGLGAVPVAAIIIGAIFIACLAWGLVAVYQMSLRQKIVDQACARAFESGDPKDMTVCEELLNNPEANIAGKVPQAIGDVVEKVAIAAMIGAGLYMMVLFGPGIATKLKQTVGAWKAA